MVAKHVNTTFFILWVFGLSWILLSYLSVNGSQWMPKVCLFKAITTLPCPSCGTTRALTFLIKGEFLTAWYWNPFSFVLALGFVITPLLLLYNKLTNNNIILHLWHLLEQMIKKKYIYIPLTLLVLINWVWNIMKGL